MLRRRRDGPGGCEADPSTAALGPRFLIWVGIATRLLPQPSGTPDVVEAAINALIVTMK